MWSSISEIKKKVIFVAGLGLAVILFLIITGKSVKDEKEDKHIHADVDTVESSIDEVEEANPESVVIDIKGEIARPGVYEITSDSRVDDIIELAGGFTEDAAVEQINLAQKVHDEMSIIVMKEGEDTLSEEGTSTSSEEGKIRVNDATQEELETLSGIGAAKAEAIIQYREEHGLFQQTEDLLNISGIGEKTLENFIEQIQIP